MLEKIIKGSTIRFALSFLLVFGALFFIFTPNYLFFKWASNFTVHVMLGYLALGLLSMMVNEPKLMFINFACCALLCIFLNKDVENPFTHIRPKSKGGESISAAHFNISRTAGNPSEIIDLIKNCNADLISVQELNNDWAEEMTDCMEENYPFMVAVPDTSFHGLAVFSKFPIHSVDTFQFNGKPNMIGRIKTKEGYLHFLSTHTIPAEDEESYNKLVSHLDLVSSMIQDIDEPLITLGEYNAVSWSEEIQNFKLVSGLNDSRKGASPGYPNGSINILEVPVDHIFFSKHLDCLEFKTLDTEASRHLGIMGIYQYKPTPQTLHVNRKT